MLLLVAGAPVTASAEWQIKPFLAGTFGGETTFVDLDDAAGNFHVGFGGSSVWLGEIFGIEADVGYIPSFFEGEGPLVVHSSVTTLTGNLVIAMPRRLARYSLRPYFVAGGGLMRAREDDLFLALPVASQLGAMDVGGGVTGFFTDRVGVSWDLRYFRSVGGSADQTGVAIGAEQLSLWRANMALVIRY